MKNRNEIGKLRNIKLGELARAFDELRCTGRPEQALAAKAASRDITKLTWAALKRLLTG